MKTRVFFLVSLIILLCGKVLISQESTNPAGSGNQITVYTTAGVADLTNQWAREFNNSHPGQTVMVKQTPLPAIRELTRSGENICFVEGEASLNGSNDPFRIVVGREIIVPVINARNPFLHELFRTGVSQEAIRSSMTVAVPVWSTLLPGVAKEKVSFYVVDDAQVRSVVGSYLGFGPGTAPVIRSVTSAQFKEVISHDPLAVGFGRLTDVMTTDMGFTENIRLLPIDKNGNGKLDYMENIYENPQEFARGVWIGKYPKGLTSNVYSVSGTQPDNMLQAAFLQWILTSGQQHLTSLGYSELVSSERQSQLDKLLTSPVIIAPVQPENNLARIILLTLVVIVVISFVADIMIRRYRLAHMAGKNPAGSSRSVFDEKHMMIPGGLYYDKTHTWAFMDQTGSVKIGLDDFIQHVTGPITRIEMKNAGDQIRKGEKLCSIIQNGKQLNIYSPVTGTVRRHNSSLLSRTSAINESPYADGWIYEIEPANWSRDIVFLQMADKYRTWLKGEFTRLKDFLASSIQMNSSAYVHVVMQDGGALQDHVLADLGPVVWEEFQRKFIDASK